MSDHFDYLAGVTAYIMMWVRANLGDERVASIYAAKKEVFDELSTALK
jgi:hypothetical protein